uniref:Uncharacterized protein n=1 Tax=Arundo donax TaxID=35708 RepID=A0A0A9CDV4_ARUDO
MHDLLSFISMWRTPGLIRKNHIDGCMQDPAPWISVTKVPGLMGRGMGFRNVERYFREILIRQQFYVPGTRNVA